MEHVVTCGTDGCGNAGVPTTITVDLSDPEIPAPVSVICGVCDTPITVVTPPIVREG